MTNPLRLFIQAGEPSGDRLGADLARRLRTRLPVELAGVGGPELEGEGLQPIFPMQELAVMGWSDVIPRLPKLLWRAGQVARAILAGKPDVAVLIDAQVFSQFVARRLRNAGYDRPVLLYVAPSVWAWKAERAATIRPLFDEVFAVLPFEPQVMKRLGGPPTSYVGHPAAAIAPRPSRPSRGPLLLLPGSREGELRRHLPVMREVAGLLASHPAIDGFVLPTLRSIERRVADEVARWPVPVTVVVGPEARAEAFGRAIAAYAVTGTITLELALANVPMVATYIADPGQAKLYLKYKPKFISLPNALLGRIVVPELLGVRRDPAGAAQAIDTILTDDGARAQLDGFREIRTLMSEGEPGTPVADPALRVLAHVPRYRDVIGS